MALTYKKVHLSPRKIYGEMPKQSISDQKDFFSVCRIYRSDPKLMIPPGIESGFRGNSGDSISMIFLL